MIVTTTGTVSPVRCVKIIMSRTTDSGSAYIRIRRKDDDRESDPNHGGSMKLDEETALQAAQILARDPDKEPGTKALADHLNLTLSEVIAAAAIGWREVDPPERPDDEWPTEWPDHAAWFLSNGPADVLIAVPIGDGPVICCEFVMGWTTGPLPRAGRVAGCGDRDTIRGWLSPAVKAALAMRRRGFRWCDLCRQHQHRDYMSGSICYSCMQNCSGVVF